MNTIEQKKILILSNHHRYTYNFRKEIIQRLVDEGYQVYISLPYGEKVELLKKMGCKYIESCLDRRGMNPFVDFKLVRAYYKTIKKLQPDIILSYTIKPNIYGGLVSRWFKTPFIANITGLGTAVGNESILQKILILLYKSAFKKATCVFFQNESNKDFFINQGIPVKKYRVIPGSGVNIDEFYYQDYPQDDGTLRFLFIGRIMRDKGIEELIEAAKKVKKVYKNLQFDALGFCEDEYRKKADLLQKENIITFHGVKNNVRDYLKKCHTAILPSHHEGMANVLLEAAATGRPVLASNVPGCKETFDDGISGFGFEAKNVKSLLKAIYKFIELPYEEKRKMGLAGRRKMEREFDRNIVVNAYLDEINLIFSGDMTNELIRKN